MICHMMSQVHFEDDKASVQMLANSQTRWKFAAARLITGNYCFLVVMCQE